MNTSTMRAVALVLGIVIGSSVLLISIQDVYYPWFVEVPFEVVDPGDGYNYATRANFTITSTALWENVWLTLYSGHEPMPALPVINFTTYTLIAVFQGERGSSGYSTNITQIMHSDREYLVFVDEVHPGEDCGTLSVMTYPYQIVKISEHLSHLPIRFVYNITTYDCV